MAHGKHWFKTDPGLRSHPNFVDLVEELHSTPIMVDGMLHGLWSVAFFDAPDGDVSRFKPRALARAIGWPLASDVPGTSPDVPGKSRGHVGTSPDVLVKSLIDTGFLVREGEKLLIHDWFDWGGALFAERSRETQKKAGQRKHTESEPGVPGTSPDVPGKSRGHPDVSPGPSRVDIDRDRDIEEQEHTCVAVDLFATEFWPRWPHRKGSKQLTGKRFASLSAKQQQGCLAAEGHIIEALEKNLLDPQFLPRAENFVGGSKSYWKEWKDGIPSHVTARGASRSGRAVDSAFGALREVARQYESGVPA